MMEMKETKVFNLSLHKELWYWLAAHPMTIKEVWPQWLSNGGTVRDCDSLCFACAYNDKRFDIETDECDCSPCPIQWSGKDCTDSEFVQWDMCRNVEERAGLALIIAELPVKDGVICI
jgi:hypothetical protein